MSPGIRDIQIHFIRRKADGSADTDNRRKKNDSPTCAVCPKAQDLF
jgi:hypothetical protein